MSTNEWNKISKTDLVIVQKYIDEVPVKLGALARELGIIVRLSSLPLNISGQICGAGDQYEIKINRHESRERQRFTLAHEIAHFLIHKDVIDEMGGQLQDNVLYRSGAGEAIEYEANRLAAQIVMPKEQVEQLTRDHSSHLSEGLIEYLAEQFGVSKAAMEIRVAA